MIEFRKMIAHKLNVKKELPILSDSCIDLEQDDIQLALPFLKSISIIQETNLQLSVVSLNQ